MRTNTEALGARKLTAVSDLIRLPSQYGTLLLLWPTLWSLFIASDGKPSFKHIAIFVLGTFLMRSAGCAINDIADRDFDPHVERTRNRPIASGRLDVKEGLAVFLVLIAVSFCLVLLLNTYTIMLAFVGLLLASVYPFVKRVSHWPQAFLGMAFGWGAVMAWSAVNGEVGLTGVLIFIANIFWSLAYDTIYALMDKDDDMKVGVKSTAIALGDRVFFALRLFYIIMAAVLAAAGVSKGLGIVYFAGLGAALIIFNSIVSLIRRNPSRQSAFRGFIGNAFAGGLILASIILDLNL